MNPVFLHPQTSFLGFGLCLPVCKDQEVALEESETRLAKLQTEREKEAEVKRRRADELKQLMEREERSRREKEVRPDPVPVFNIGWETGERTDVCLLSPAAGAEGEVSSVEHRGRARCSPGDKVQL